MGRTLTEVYNSKEPVILNYMPGESSQNIFEMKEKVSFDVRWERINEKLMRLINESVYYLYYGRIHFGENQYLSVVEHLQTHFHTCARSLQTKKRECFKNSEFMQLNQQFVIEIPMVKLPCISTSEHIRLSWDIKVNAIKSCKDIFEINIFCSSR